MSVVFIDGAMVHYEVLGKGRPVFFLHGWVGSWKYWIPSMQIASTSYRAYALDLWGFGETAHNRPAYDLDRQADLLRAFLDEMGIGRVALVGHGLGGLVALNFARRWQEHLDRMLLVTCPMKYESVSARLWTAQPGELVDWLADRSPESTVALSDTMRMDSQAVAVSLAGLRANDQFEEARQVLQPCLFVYGQNDPVVAPPPPERQLDVPHSTHTITLEGSGHFPMLDEPQRFNRLLIDFLALDPGASPQELQLKEEWKRRVR